jgi:hypothetical protein
MTHKVQDLNRRNLSFSKSKVREVLPEYFLESYPNIVTFLEKYYEYLENENTHSFKRDINQLFVLRDPDQVDLDKLDYILQEVGLGLKSSSFFDNPRLMTSLLSRFYRVKGTRSSIEGFFRGFFGQEVNVEYPKRNMFIVGESEIGYESLRFIQNNALYQIFSLLIKSALGTNTYNDLYLKFVHPAGFYFAGQVELEGVKAFALTSASEDPRDSAVTGPIIISQSDFAITNEFTQITGLFDSVGDGVDYRIRLDDKISLYSTLTPTQLENYYSSLAEVLTPNSFTFDDSDTRDSALRATPDFSLALETMDNEMYTIYLDSIGDSFY